MNSETLETYISHFKRLNRSLDSTTWSKASKYGAPYKPLLLLCVLDMAEDGTLDRNRIRWNADLEERFGSYWDAVTDRSPNLEMPFFHMKNEPSTGDPYWFLVHEDGTIDEEMSARDTAKKTGLEWAKLAEDLYELIQDEEAHSLLRRTLIQTYFSQDDQGRIERLGRESRESHQYAQELITSLEEDESVSSTVQTRNVRVRQQAFRQVVVGYAYEYQCAFCEIKIQTPEDHSVIEAAHIEPWSESTNDDPRNGMGLCRLCHWIYDEGLMCVSPDHRLRFSDPLLHPENILKHVGGLEGKKIVTPQKDIFRPGEKHLRWHRKNKFRGNA